MPRKSATLEGYEGKRLTPLAAIRTVCRTCMGNSSHLVADCASDSCPLHSYRTGAIQPGASRRLLKVIKTFCATCAADGDVAACAAGRAYLDLPACPVWPYRLGKSPYVSARVREKRRELGRKYGFGSAQEPVSAVRIDDEVAGDSSGRPEVEGLEISNPLFTPTAGSTVPGWCGAL